jgi:hypothetical protein
VGVDVVGVSRDIHAMGTFVHRRPAADVPEVLEHVRLVGVAVVAARTVVVAVNERLPVT